MPSVTMTLAIATAEKRQLIYILMIPVVARITSIGISSAINFHFRFASPDAFAVYDLLDNYLARRMPFNMHATG